MPGVHDTAYPRLKSSVSAQELAAVYTPTAEEVTLAHQLAKDTRNRICFLVLLKTFQRLGYFELLHKIPPPIAEHIALLYGVHHGALEWEAYDGSGTRRRHVAFIRDRLSVKPFDDASRKLLAESVRQAARVKEDTADIINVAIEEPIRQRYELPGFTTLLVESQRGKAEVNRHFYSGVCRALGAQRCRKIDEMLEADQPNRRSLWQNLKLDAGAPTLTQLRLLAQRLEWLKTLDLTSDDSFAGLPPVKVAHFALEARSLDAGRMLEMEEQKRYTLAAALVRQQRARCLDDLGEMLIKRMRKAHRRAQEAYDEYLLRQQSQTDQLIAVLRQILLAWQTPGSKVERLEAIGRAIGDQAEQLIAECQTRAA